MLDASSHAVILHTVKRSIAALLLFLQLLVALMAHVPVRPSTRAQAIDVALAGAQITRLPERTSEVAKPDAIATTADEARLPTPTFTRASIAFDVVGIGDVSFTVPRARGPPADLVSRS